jgi:F-type H+-transporting ATPase subunit delta
MRISSLAKRYSRALFDSFSDNQRGGVLSVLKSFLQIFNTFEEIRFALLSPVVTVENKLAVVDIVLKECDRADLKESPEALRNFFKVLLDSARIPIFEQIVAAFEVDVLAASGVTFLRIESARSLSEDEAKNLMDILGASFGKKIKMQLSENQSIIGGLRIWKGDELIDASVINQLQQVRDSLIVQ